MTTYMKLNSQLNIAQDGAIPLHKDKEAVRAYFIEDVNQNTVFFHSLKEKLDYLVENDYIEKSVLDKYSFDFIKGLFQRVYDKKYRFKSFMGAYKFYTQYALKNTKGDRYLERYEDRVAFNALMMGNGDERLATAIAEEIINNRYQPATPTFLNAGKAQRGEYVSCFLLDVADDMGSIGRTITNALQLSKKGGGVGINLSNIRKLGDPIKNHENASSGVVPVMKLLEDAFMYANQLGQRKGAGAVYLNVFHGDILTFLSTKKENAEASKQVKTLSLGIVVPDKYYELVEADESIHLFSPYDVSKVYGVPFSQVDITEEYDAMIRNPHIRSTVMKARDLNKEIRMLQQESGYPYIMNVDTANRENPIKGKITMSNLCSEILQVQTPSVINEKQEYEVLGTDISCNLGSLNLPNLIDSDVPMEKSIDVAVRALTHITTVSDIEAVPTVKNGNDRAHTIGLGAMGLHTLFALNEMHYGSKEALKLTDILFMTINYYTLKTSNRIAVEQKETFEGFEDSKYATGEYFDKYINSDYEDEYLTMNPKLSELLKGHHIPTRGDWEALRDDVMNTGLFHQNRMAVAPNGSISYINETSASIHPITSVVEGRNEDKLGTIYYPAPHLSTEVMPYYTSAYDMSMLKVIDTYAIAQKHVDQGMSLTLFMRSELGEDLYPWKPEGGKYTTRDLTLISHYAWKKGIKSTYYVRTVTDEDTEVGVAQCESCII